MEGKLNLIKGITLLDPLDNDTLTENLRGGKFVVSDYEKGSIIHLEGEVCSKLEIILSGKVVVERIDEQGNLLKISEFYRNDLLGAGLVFSNDPYYPMTVSTHLVTKVLEIKKPVLFELLSNNTKFLGIFLELLSDRTLVLGDIIKQYLKKTIRENILNYLEHERRIQGSNHIKLKISKKELAEKFGVQRTSISRELAKMRDEGLVRFDRDSITLIN